MVDPEMILDAWRIARPRTSRRAAEGANNRTFFIDSLTGPYILRVYSEGVDPRRIHYEHAVLLALQDANLPFAVPRPVAAASGGTFIAPASASGCLVALFASIPGRSVAAMDATTTATCGAALGELDNALADVKIAESLEPPAFGDLRAHPLVPDLAEHAALPPIPPDLRTRVQRLLEELAAVQPVLYARLPGQIIHADFDPSNVLLDGDRVTGVVDFEFTAPAPRAMDLAVGLHGFAGPPKDADDYWIRIEAFATGYARRSRLPLEEISALPDLMRLRGAASLVHWMGRWQRNLASDANLAWRVERFLRLDDGLAVWGKEMRRRVALAQR